MHNQHLTRFRFFPNCRLGEKLACIGFRVGAVGTHTSRTIMLAELEATFAAAPQDAGRADYAAAIVEANCLGKPTTATRRLTNRRLGELST